MMEAFELGFIVIGNFLINKGIRVGMWGYRIVVLMYKRPRDFVISYTYAVCKISCKFCGVCSHEIHCVCQVNFLDHFC